jgi:putative acetyltransferase
VDVEIGPERREDHDAVRRVVLAAFTTHHSVADLVDLIRASPQYVAELSLVARVDGEVVGHVMLSHAEVVAGDGTRHDVLTLSPLSVDPAHQRHGIGGALVRAGLERAQQTSAPLVLLEGSPGYYPRFGFRDARDLGITFDLPDWAPPDAGMTFTLPAYDPAVRGNVRYPPAFAAVAD